MKLSELGHTPVDFSVLKSIFPDHKSINNKISELEKSGRLIRLKKGMYVVSPAESGQLLSMELIANHLYGPSYVSMQSALRYYELIPEMVCTLRSMTIKHTRTFRNSLGRFEYMQCSKAYFPIGIRQEIHGDTAFLIATPEKALCDVLVNTALLNLRSQKELFVYLEEDLRLDMYTFRRMDARIFEQCAQIGKKKTMMMNLLKIMK
jgi:hypothetical protein